MSIHHLGRQIGDADMESESASHRDTAVQLYVDALKNPELHPDGLALLDTALILFAIDVRFPSTSVLTCGGHMMLT